MVLVASDGARRVGRALPWVRMMLALALVAALALPAAAQRPKQKLTPQDLGGAVAASIAAMASATAALNQFISDVSVANCPDIPGLRQTFAKLYSAGQDAADDYVAQKTSTMDYWSRGMPADFRRQHQMAADAYDPNDKFSDPANLGFWLGADAILKELRNAMAGARAALASLAAKCPPPPTPPPPPPPKNPPEQPPDGGKKKPPEKTPTYSGLHVNPPPQGQTTGGVTPSPGCGPASPPPVVTGPVEVPYFCTSQDIYDWLANVYSPNLKKAQAQVDAWSNYVGQVHGAQMGLPVDDPMQQCLANAYQAGMQNLQQAASYRDQWDAAHTEAYRHRIDCGKPHAQATWTGTHAGVYVAGSLSTVTTTEKLVSTGETTFQSHDCCSGIGAGASIGHDWELPGNWVVGAIANGIFPMDRVTHNFIGGSYIRSTMDFTATFEARGGYLVERNLLLYGHGGLAIGVQNLKLNFAGAVSSTEDVTPGFVIGAGAE